MKVHFGNRGSRKRFIVSNRNIPGTWSRSLKGWSQSRPSLFSRESTGRMVKLTGVRYYLSLLWCAPDHELHNSRPLRLVLLLEEPEVYARSSSIKVSY